MKVKSFPLELSPEHDMIAASYTPKGSSMITHRQRLETCLSGNTPDRPPVALWRHFPVDDQSPETLAAATLHWQQQYDWDLVKVTPASSFCLKGWSSEDEWRGDGEGTRAYTRRVIARPEDWARLTVLDPDSPHLAAQLKCLSLLRGQISSDTPLIQTIFSPLSQAKNLVGGEALIVHLRENPHAVQKGLETIAETTRRFIDAAVRRGIDGIFYAVQHAQASLLTEAEFVNFGSVMDLSVLETASSLWFNMVHLHGENVYFNAVSSYPVQAINWHDRDTAPNLSEGLEQFSGVLCGGLSRDTIVYGDAAAVSSEAADAIAQTQGQRLLLGTGCVVPIIAPHGNLLAARKSVERQ
jgi:uroporphyrinogen decarboxylase